MGQTGSGKSTLTRLVNRIYDVESGNIAIDGRDVREWNLESLRSQISVIEQDVFLFSRSIAENIALGLGQHATVEAIEAAARAAQAHDFTQSFQDGYDTVIGERGVTLSGGQRLAIARALLTDPRILVLDDPTSAINSATEDAPSSGPSTGCWWAAPPSSSPTGCRRFARPARSWCCTGVSFSIRATTLNYSSAANCTSASSHATTEEAQWVSSWRASGPKGTTAATATGNCCAASCATSGRTGR